MTNRIPPRRRRLAHARILALAAAAVLLAAACNSTPPASSATVAPPASLPASLAPSVAPSAPESAAPSAVAANTLDVEAKDFSFGLPASAPAGVTHLTLTNTGKEEHQAQVARLTPGTTFAAVTAALQNPDPSAALKLLTLVGGPNLVQPGSSGSTDVTLDPGAHIFLCFISGADDIPHLAKGMVAPLEVTAPATAGSLPTGDAAVTLQDFEFVGLDSLSVGKHTIAVTNKGPQAHEAGIVKLADGTTAADIVAMFKATTPAAGPPPWTDVGGTAGIAVGGSATVDVDLPAGNYAFICFVPDTATGKPHAQLGMVGGFTVK